SLAPGGLLAVQMPRNFSAPSHTSISDAARNGPWRTKLEPLLRPSPTGDPAYYYGLLAPRAAALDIWETEDLQILDGENPVEEWKVAAPAPRRARRAGARPLRGRLRRAHRACLSTPGRRAHALPLPPSLHPRQGALRWSRGRSSSSPATSWGTSPWPWPRRS